MADNLQTIEVIKFTNIFSAKCIGYKGYLYNAYQWSNNVDKKTKNVITAFSQPDLVPIKGEARRTVPRLWAWSHVVS